MRRSLLIILLSAWSALAMEMWLSDEERFRQSDAVFTGTVTSTNLLRELQSGALCSAQIRVESVQRSYPVLETNTVIYYEQTCSVQDERGFRMHGRICPGYPDIRVGQRMKLWCIRQTVEGYTNVLFVPSSAWAKTQ